MTTQEPIATDNALIIADKATVASAFETDETIAALLTKIESELRAEVMTADTKEGRERIKSQAYKISRSKTMIDTIGKGLTEEARILQAAINARRNIVTARLDKLRDEVRAPLTAWEGAEDARVKRHKDRMATEFSASTLPVSSAALHAMRNRAAGVVMDESWEEFTVDATKVQADFIRFLDMKIEAAEQTEARDAELAQLRAAEAKRREAEAEEIRQRALRDAEERKAREAEESKAREAQAESDRKIAELTAKLEAANAEKDAAEALARDAAAKAMADLVAAEQARATEAEEVMQVQAKFSEEEKQPILDFAPVNESLVAERAIATAVLAILKQSFTIEAMADEVASAIVLGEIPYVKVVL